MPVFSFSSHRQDEVDTPDLRISELNGWPGRSSVNASPTLSRESAHDSKPKWFAITYFVQNLHLLLSPGFYRRFPCLFFLLLIAERTAL
jgi:hypothetical protein